MGIFLGLHAQNAHTYLITGGYQVDHLQQLDLGQKDTCGVQVATSGPCLMFGQPEFHS